MNRSILNVLGQNGAHVPQGLVALETIIGCRRARKQRLARVFGFSRKRLVALKHANVRRVLDRIFKLRNGSSFGLGYFLALVSNGVVRNREPRVDVELHCLHEHLGLVENVFCHVESRPLQFKRKSKEFGVNGPLVAVLEESNGLFLGLNRGKRDLEPIELFGGSWIRRIVGKGE